MTRKEARKQIDSGWITPQLGALLMGFDMDTKRLKAFSEMGAIETRTTSTGEQLRFSDLVGVGGIDVNKTLNKLWPIDRRKKATRVQTIRVLDTQTAKETFNSRWFRVYRAVSKLISDPDASLSMRELKLMHQLLALSRKVRGFELILTNQKLMELTRLDDEWVPKTRRALEHRGLLTAEADGSQWIYNLIDPLSGKAFAIDEEDGPSVIASSTWADIDDAA